VAYVTYHLKQFRGVSQDGQMNAQYGTLLVLLRAFPAHNRNQRQRILWEDFLEGVLRIDPVEESAMFFPAPIVSYGKNTTPQGVRLSASAFCLKEVVPLCWTGLRPS
jgi:hypothetical protein